MKVELSRAHFPVTVLGYGSRAGVWFQGCTLHCPGCMSRDTWDRQPDRAVDTAAVVRWCAGLPADQLDGVTISGGEPFDQPAALEELLRGLHDWRKVLAHPVDLLCYSGRSLGVLRRRHGAALGLLDAVIPGRYDGPRGAGKIWRGSANQPLVPLTELGHARYDAMRDAEPGPRRLQASAEDGAVRYIGVPLPGDLTRIEDALARRGIAHREVSWR